MGDCSNHTGTCVYCCGYKSVENVLPPDNCLCFLILFPSIRDLGGAHW